MLDNFLIWQESMRRMLSECGHWSAAINPRSGYPVNGSRGERWSEVEAARLFQGLEIVNKDSICHLVHHPDFGKSSFLVTSMSTF